MTSDRKWNVDDVQRLVVAAQAITELDSPKYTSDKMRLDDLSEALAPFQPDPDAELIEKMARVFDAHDRFDECARDLIAAVRDHDAKAVNE